MTSSIRSEPSWDRSRLAELLVSAEIATSGSTSRITHISRDFSQELIVQPQISILRPKPFELGRSETSSGTWGGTHDSVPMRLTDFDNPTNNPFVVSDEVVFCPQSQECRYHVARSVKGLPLVVMAAKTPVDSSATWVKSAYDIAKAPPDRERQDQCRSWAFKATGVGDYAVSTPASWRVRP